MSTNDDERLARVEVQIEALDDKVVMLHEHVTARLDEKFDSNERRLDELKELVHVVINKPTLTKEVLFGVGKFVNENWKTMVLVIVTGGGAAAVQALSQ